MTKRTKKRIWQVLKATFYVTILTAYYGFIFALTTGWSGDFMPAAAVLCWQVLVITAWLGSCVGIVRMELDCD